MENNKEKINPFTNQPVPPPSSLKPSPPFNLPGETKPPIQVQEDPKKDKPTKKFDFKAFFLYVILIGLGIVLAKYALDFFVPKQQKSNTLQSHSSANKPLIEPLIKLIPGKLQANSQSSLKAKDNQPLLTIKKKINQAINPYILSGIFSSGEQSYCIINDKILMQGDSIEEAKVTRIDPSEVELQLNNKSIKLNLRGK